MAQFDVHPNPSVRQREAVPYLVVLQSDLLAHLPTLVVMPLVVEQFNAMSLPHRLSPSFRVQGRLLFLWPQQTATILARSLPPAVESLRAEQAQLIDAFDAVVSGV